MPCSYVVCVGISLKFICIVVLVTVASAVSQNMHVSATQQQTSGLFD